MDGEDAMLEVQEQPQLQGRGDRLYEGDAMAADREERRTGRE